MTAKVPLPFSIPFFGPLFDNWTDSDYTTQAIAGAAITFGSVQWGVQSLLADPLNPPQTITLSVLVFFSFLALPLWFDKIREKWLFDFLQEETEKIEESVQEKHDEWLTGMLHLELEREEILKDDFMEHRELFFAELRSEYDEIGILSVLPKLKSLSKDTTLVKKAKNIIEIHEARSWFSFMDLRTMSATADESTDDDSVEQGTPQEENVASRNRRFDYSTQWIDIERQALDYIHATYQEGEFILEPNIASNTATIRPDGYLEVADSRYLIEIKGGDYAVSRRKVAQQYGINKESLLGFMVSPQSHVFWVPISELPPVRETEEE